MAILASVAITNSAVNTAVKVDCVLTVSNTGGSPVNITEINPWVNPAYATNLSGLAPGLSQAKQIPAGGSLSYSFTQAFYCNIQTGTPEFGFQVGATVKTDDGSVTAATPAEARVTPTQFIPGGTLPGAYPNLPVAGQLRFEANYNSGLEVLLGP